MPKEIWKPIPIPEFKGRYEVSNLGRVRRVARICTVWKFQSGRLYVSLHSDELKKRNRAQGRRGNLKNISVHRLVAMAFIGMPNPGEQVNHKNGKKTDNRDKNLEWVTGEENRAHAKKMGLYKSPPNKKVDAKVAIKMHEAGKSQREIAKHFRCSKSAVKAALDHHLHGVPWSPSGVKKRHRITS